MELVLIFVGGVVVGVLLTLGWFRSRKPSGAFHINLNDPMEETLRLEIDDNLNHICSKKRISLAVNVIGKNSLK